jgi:hypothetical protein
MSSWGADPRISCCALHPGLSSDVPSGLLRDSFRTGRRKHNSGYLQRTALALAESTSRNELGGSGNGRISRTDCECSREGKHAKGRTRSFLERPGTMFIGDVGEGDLWS